MVTINTELMIRKVIAKYLDMDEVYVFLFGSRAAGSGSPRSDYDIGLYQGKKIPFSVMAEINGELEESCIPQFIDVVDFSRTSPEFRKVALRRIKIWNRPKKTLNLTLPS